MDLMIKVEKIFQKATAKMSQAEDIKDNKLITRLTNPCKPIKLV